MLHRNEDELTLTQRWLGDALRRVGKLWDLEREERGLSRPDPSRIESIVAERIHLINQMRLGWPWYYTGHSNSTEWEAAGSPPAPVYSREMDDRAYIGGKPN